MNLIRRVFLGSILPGFLLFLLLGHSAWAAQTPLKKGVSRGGAQRIAVVDGFRSAKFGMSQQQVIKAIFDDFKIPKSKIILRKNPTEQTTAYLVRVDNILPESGPAQVGYIFGFRTKKLFQVNVIWGNPVVKEANPEGLVSTANLLRNHLLRKGFKRDQMIANAQLKDGSILVFRGADKNGRMVIVLLNNPAFNPDPKSKEKVNPEMVKKMSLRLSYIEKPGSPDIYKIGKDEF